MDEERPQAAPVVEAHAQEIEALFADSGRLAQAIRGFRSRAAQTAMAVDIARTLVEQGTLLAEAGTGTGKTFAYLVPALLWGGKVVLSTGTKTLQDQLFLRDIPTIKNALRAPVTVALLKGRSNYLCHYHLERTLEQGRLGSREDVGYLREISRFAKTTQTGDKAELARVPESAMIWNWVTSTKDTCLGAECPHAQDCFVTKARKDAQQADVVVVNHHLFFADIALKETGMAELLPSANTIIFDEAHQLPDVATLFFGETVSTSQLLELCRDVLVEGLAHARDGADWARVVAPVERACRDVRLAFAEDHVRMSIEQIAPSSPFFAQLDMLKSTLAALIDVLETQAARAESIELCRARAIMLHELLLRWKQPDAPLPPDEARVLWLEAFSSALQLHRTPLSIAPIFAKQRALGPRAWIFTSATLAVKSDFTHFTSQMGLWDVPARVWPSPFDYSQQAMLYVPGGLPEPHALGYLDAVLDAAWPLIVAAGGRTFFLCTTLKAVRYCAEALRARLAAAALPFPLFVQGEWGKTELLERFRRAGNGVLVGSQSFWEGVDVRGEALSLVIIDKLPFAPPDDPVLAARLSDMEQRGVSGFAHHQLPEAIISLKQGAGRLIRDEADRGVLMICDPRIISKPYGRRIWQSLPPFARTREAQIAVDFLSAQCAATAS